ncbi:MAG: GTP-binding protein [Lachnospiraceae bacterium]|nr:GTP-binding protein [Lachnospiraceae bacterium]
MTKVDIISGFLGAGKTTLIKKLIKEVFAGQQIVLIENEFGEIGIDGGFLKDAGINITEMNSGCICCSLVGDFATALKKVVDEFHPERIIIEPSGVGKLSDVERAVLDVAEEDGLEVATATTVVDAKKAKLYMKNFGEFFNNQVETARCVVLSRTQDVTPEKLDEVVKLVREKNHEAALITTPWDEIDGKTIFGAMSDAKALERELIEEHEHHHDHEHHHHDHDHDHDHDHGHHHDHDHDHDHDHEHEHHHDHDHEHEHHHDHEHEHEHHHDHDHHHHHHDHDADEVFTSWGVETPKKFDEGELSEILDKLANTEDFGQVLRAKGIVPATSGKWLHFDLTPGEKEIREGSADYTGRLCVIGADIDESALEKLFGV